MIPNNQPDAAARFQRLVGGREVRLRIDLLQGAPGATGRRRGGGRVREDGRDHPGGGGGASRATDSIPTFLWFAAPTTTTPPGERRPEARCGQPGPGPGEDHRGRRSVLVLLPGLPQGPTSLRIAQQMFRDTQSRFWAVNMGPPPAYDPDRRDRVPPGGRPGGRGIRRDPRPTWFPPTIPAGTGSTREWGETGPESWTFRPFSSWTCSRSTTWSRPSFPSARRPSEAKVEVELAMTLPSAREEQGPPRVPPGEAHGGSG